MSPYLSTIAAQTFAPREYELPIFIHTKFHNPSDDSSARRRQIRAHTAHYSGYYKARTLRRRPAVRPAACPHRGAERARFRTNNRTDLQLAPNRYRLDADSLSERVRRSGVGRRGRYDCFSVVRDPSTVRGHLAVSADSREQRMFYDVPAGGEVLGLRHVRQYFRGKMRSGSHGGHDVAARKRRMAAYRRQPGPAEYYPQNYVSMLPEAAFKGRVPPMRLPRAAYFPAGSCVPINDRFWRPELSVWRPGPGRYDVTGSMSRRERIAGSGHRHVFGSRVVRFTPSEAQTSLPPSATLSVDRTTNRPPLKSAPQMKNDAAYMQRIRNPMRKAISFPTSAIAAAVDRPLRFNTIERPKKRTRLRNNYKVAFDSGTTRWPLHPNEQGWMHKQTITETTTAMRKRAAGPSSRTGARPMMVTETAAERLQRMPPRFALLRPRPDRSDKMRNTFAAMPPPRILVEDRLAVDETRLQLLNTELDVEPLYTEEVLQLKRDWEARKLLLGFV